MTQQDEDLEVAGWVVPMTCPRCGGGLELDHASVTLDGTESCSIVTCLPCRE